MTRATIARGAFGTGIVLLALAGGYRAFHRDARPAAATAPSTRLAAPEASPAGTSPDFLYGRITTVEGANYEGRLRWGDGEEAFWGDYFNGTKSENSWAAQVPPERLPRESHTIEIFGMELFHRERPVDLGRPFLARFGDIARIEAHGNSTLSVCRPVVELLLIQRLGRLQALAQEVQSRTLRVSPAPMSRVGLPHCPPAKTPIPYSGGLAWRRSAIPVERTDESDQRLVADLPSASSWRCRS
jgi:hypothetical protein